MNSTIDEALRRLNQEEVVAIPTETVYGLAALATSERAVAKIYEIKGRPSSNPLIIHFASLQAIKDFGFILSPDFIKLALAFWPGPLSIITQKHPAIAKNALAGLETSALRVPAHPITQEILNLLKKPIAAPSANRSNHISPTSSEHVRLSLGDKCPFIVEGGVCEKGLESSVIDLSCKPYKLLRPGVITKEEIEAVLHEKIELSAAVEENFKSPGMMKKHYSPKQSVEWVSTQKMNDLNFNRVALLHHSELASPQTHSVRLQKTAQAYEKELYSSLYFLESLAIEKIYIEELPQDSSWLAVHNRISKMLC